MANHSINMNKIRHILRMFSEGKSKSFISARSGVARNTVKKYLQRFISLHLSYDDVQKLSDKDLDLLITSGEPEPEERYKVLQSYMPSVEKELRRRGMTRSRVWKEYKAKHPDGYEFSQFCLYIRRFRESVSPVMRMIHKVGDKMFVDYAGEKLSYIDASSGESHDVEVFVSILGASQLIYAEATRTQQKEDFLTSCENAMHYYGGVPQAIVPDNLATAVTKANRYEPTVNETFEDFAEHYQTAILPTRSRAPRDKAHVENVVLILYRNLYVDMDEQVFFSLEEINHALHRQLDAVNCMVMQGRGYSRRDQFEEIERSELKALPALRYEFKRQAIVTVMRNCYVCLSLDKHYYSAPHTLIGQRVKILFSSTAVEIYHKLDLVAKHPRETRRFGYTTIEDHLSSTHRYVHGWTAEKFIGEGAKIDPIVATYFDRLIASKAHPEQGFKSCSGLLAIARKIGSERFIRACIRATEYNSYSYRTILNIVEHQLDTLNTDEQAEAALPLHENIRGEEYYK